MTQSSAPASVRGEHVSHERLQELYWHSPDTMMDASMRMDLRKAVSELLDRRAKEDEASHTASIGAPLKNCIGCANGNDLPEGEECAMCGRVGSYYTPVQPINGPLGSMSSAPLRSSANGEAEEVRARALEEAWQVVANIELLSDDSAPDDYRDGYEAGVNECSVFAAQAIRALSSPRPEPVKVGDPVVTPDWKAGFVAGYEQGVRFRLSSAASSTPTEGDARRVEALERLTELYESEYDADASFVRPQWLQQALSSSRPEPTPDADEALSLAQALRAADYDTHKLFDLLVEAADLIEGQHRALAATHAAIARELLEALKDLADRYEGNLYSNMAARKARAIIAKAEGRS